MKASVAASALALTLTGCSAQVSGFVSPVSHDYGDVAWVPLTVPVEQAFVTGPGYADAVANDPKTTPLLFQQRLAALPEDARAGRLLEIQVGLRQPEEISGPWQTGARVQLVYDADHDLLADDVPATDPSSAPLLDVAIDDLQRDGEWLTITSPPDVPSERTVALRIVPGMGHDAMTLEVGVTPDRAPYGTWRATDESGVDLPGALLVRTTYERDVAVQRVLGGAVDRMRGAVQHDVVFSVVYLVMLASLAVAVVRLRLSTNERGA